MPEGEEKRSSEVAAADGDGVVPGATADAGSERPRGPKDGLTPEQAERLHALTHPEGDPYSNARDLGFYCEQCG